MNCSSAAEGRILGHRQSCGFRRLQKVSAPSGSGRGRALREEIPLRQILIGYLRLGQRGSQDRRGCDSDCERSGPMLGSGMHFRANCPHGILD